MLKKILLSMYLLIFCGLYAQDTNDILLGKYFTINSEILNQKRDIYVSLPNSYDASNREYPVLYILDGQGSFQFAASVVKFLSSSSRIPSMIVVGIPNIDRTYDLTPARERFRKSGNGKKFLKFLTEEVKDFINDNYRTCGYNILSGHSLGGNFTVFSLFRNPDDYNAYIAISPALISADYYTLNLVKNKISRIDLEQKYLYTAIGDEPLYVKFMEDFDKTIILGKKEGFIYHFDELKTEDHLSIRLKGVYNGLEKLFSEWVIKAPTLKKGIQAIEAHFENFEDKFEFEYTIPESFLNTIGYRLIGANKLDLAIELFHRITQLYPGSANAYHSYGEALRKNKSFEEAKRNFEIAVKIAQEINHPKLDFYQKELREIKRLVFEN